MTSLEFLCKNETGNLVDGPTRALDEVSSVRHCATVTLLLGLEGTGDLHLSSARVAKIHLFHFHEEFCAREHFS